MTYACFHFLPPRSGVFQSYATQRRYNMAIHLYAVEKNSIQKKTRVPTEFKRVNDATQTITASVWNIFLPMSMNSDWSVCRNRQYSVVKIKPTYPETNLYSPFNWNPNRRKFDSKKCKWRWIVYHIVTLSTMLALFHRGLLATDILF